MQSTRVPFAIQCIAWLFGIAACLAGMLNLVAEWDPNLATVQFFVLVIAPVVWMIERKRPKAASPELSPRIADRRAYCAAAAVAIASLATCFVQGGDMVGLPPAYHDEYSYLFEAKILLAGALSVPGHPTHPELFDQMHVLNEGRMASRYYPGTAIWLAPWVAIGHPYWGHWLASSLASVCVFWTGYELGRLRLAIVSGFACALSPGIAIFANLLLAHQPTFLGLSLFVWAFVKWQRTLLLRDLFAAGCGLSFAMICRPATAASVGLPFGIVFFYRLVFARDVPSHSVWRLRMRDLLAIGTPLIAGWILMLAYHRNVTGSWTTSPYQLYTNLYTPRHVYGFNNVLRGELKLGPKVIEAYDRWAKNLTPELAMSNVRDRWMASWLWTFDIVALLMSSIVVVGTVTRWDSRWVCIGLAILSLHLMHIPYWYTGIMGWHYVFESAPFWCLLLGLATELLFREWQVSGRWLMSTWWTAFLAVTLTGAYFPLRLPGQLTSSPPRSLKAMNSIRHPRTRYAEFNNWLQKTVKDLPAVVMIAIDPDDQHVDYVVNSPSLDDEILRVRNRIGVMDPSVVLAAFPNRHVYLCDPKKKSIEQLR